MALHKYTEVMVKIFYYGTQCSAVENNQSNTLVPLSAGHYLATSTSILVSSQTSSFFLTFSEIFLHQEDTFLYNTM